MFFIFALHYFHAGLGVNSIRLHYAYKRKIHVSLKKRTGKESLRLPTPRVGHSCVITFNLPLWTSPDHCTFSVWLHFSSTKINSNYFGQNTVSTWVLCVSLSTVRSCHPSFWFLRFCVWLLTVCFIYFIWPGLKAHVCFLFHSNLKALF